MKKLIMLSILLITSVSYAKLNVVTAYPYIADIAGRIGGEYVNVKSLADGRLDPHFITPKPSLIAVVRNAHILFINGAELETGWLPPLIRESRNAVIQVGASGFCDLSSYIKLIDKPLKVTRDMGDVHPSGNPHYHLNPDNIIIIANAVMKKLSAADAANAKYFEKNYASFSSMWLGKIKEWDSAMKHFKGIKVIEYHKLYSYFLKRYGLLSSGELEPLPGITPSSGHIRKVIDIAVKEKVRFIFNDVYHSSRPAEMVSEKSGVKMIILPHDVNAVEEAKDIVSLFDTIVKRIVHGG
jgi:zinc/manganese transport system substrate-binding protein